MLGVVEHVGGGLVDRHGARAGGRIGPLPRVQAERIEARRFGCGGHGASIAEPLETRGSMDRPAAGHAEGVPNLGLRELIACLGRGCVRRTGAERRVVICVRSYRA